MVTAMTHPRVWSCSETHTRPIPRRTNHQGGGTATSHRGRPAGWVSILRRHAHLPRPLHQGGNVAITKRRQGRVQEPPSPDVRTQASGSDQPTIGTGARLGSSLNASAPAHEHGLLENPNSQESPAEPWVPGRA